MRSIQCCHPGITVQDCRLSFHPWPGQYHVHVLHAAFEYFGPSQPPLPQNVMRHLRLHVPQSSSAFLSLRQRLHGLFAPHAVLRWSRSSDCSDFIRIRNKVNSLLHMSRRQQFGQGLSNKLLPLHHAKALTAQPGWLHMLKRSDTINLPQAGRHVVYIAM